MLLLAAVFWQITFSGSSAQADNATDNVKIARGKYLSVISGCVACHTDKPNKGEPFAGGLELKSPFGTFYTPNITIDLKTGIGYWNDEEFYRALRHGKSPQDKPYYPAFPYTSYTKLTRSDILAIKAYLFSLPPVSKKNREHNLNGIYRLRAVGLRVWQSLYFTAGEQEPDKTRSAEWNHGRYLANAALHCTECHTPRTKLGGLIKTKWFQGTDKGIDGSATPNIMPTKEGNSHWTYDDYDAFLAEGLDPNGDYVGGVMGEVLEETAELTNEDRAALIKYLQDPAE